MQERSPTIGTITSRITIIAACGTSRTTVVIRIGLRTPICARMRLIPRPRSRQAPPGCVCAEGRGIPPAPLLSSCPRRWYFASVFRLGSTSDRFFYCSHEFLLNGGTTCGTPFPAGFPISPVFYATSCGTFDSIARLNFSKCWS